jgi:hypothetical protein
MAAPLSLLEFVRAVLDQDALRADFAADPAGTLAEHGLDELSPADVHDALVLVEDSRTVDFSRDYLADTPSDPEPSLPPVPGGDDHEAATEYLTSYVTGEVDGRGSAAGAEQWSDPDADPDTGATPGAAIGSDTWSTAGTAVGPGTSFGSGDPGTEVAQDAPSDGPGPEAPGTWGGHLDPVGAGGFDETDRPVFDDHELDDSNDVDDSDVDF